MNSARFGKWAYCVGRILFCSLCAILGAACGAVATSLYMIQCISKVCHEPNLQYSEDSFGVWILVAPLGAAVGGLTAVLLSTVGSRRLGIYIVGSVIATACTSFVLFLAFGKLICSPSPCLIPLAWSVSLLLYCLVRLWMLRWRGFARFRKVVRHEPHSSEQ